MSLDNQSMGKHTKNYLTKIFWVFVLTIATTTSYAQTSLQAPEGLRVEIVEQGSDSVTISWQFPSPPPSGFSGFNIYRNDLQINANSVLLQDTSYLDTDLPNDSTYTYQVDAVYGSDTSERSNRGTVSIREQFYFNLASGNPLGDTWSVYIDSAMLGDAALSPGDELAIYDGDTIVGRDRLIKQPLPGNNPPDVVVAFSELDDGTGYNPGNPYSFKLYDASMDRVYEMYDDTLIEADTASYTADVFPSSYNAYSILHISFTPDLPAPQIESIESEGHDVTIEWTLQNASRDFIGFDIFRDDNRLNSYPLPGNSFTDSNVLSGNYTYHVNAVYDEDSAVSSAAVDFELGTIYYDPVNTEPEASNPMNLHIHEASVMDSSLRAFDEIGIFKHTAEDTLCIAAKSLTYALDGSQNDSLFIPQDDPNTPAIIEGFSDGDTLHYRLFDYDSDTEYRDVIVSFPEGTNDNFLTFAPDTTNHVSLSWLPYPPVGLSAAIDGYDATLSWSENPENSDLSLAGYNIYRDQQQLNNAFIQDTFYYDTGLYVDNYQYRVKAVYEETESRFSDYLEVTIPMQYFIPESEDTAAGTMDFYITGATIDAEELEAYDEIGIFAPTDTGAICVGSGSLHNSVTAQNPLHIKAYQHNPSQPGDYNGYQPGDSIMYRFWKQSTGQVASSVDYTPSHDDYDFTHFSTGDTCYAELSFTPPPPVNFYFETTEYCEENTGNIFIAVDAFTNISGFTLKIDLDTTYYSYDTIVSVAEFIDDYTVTNDTTQVTVTWSGDEQHTMPDESQLFDLTIETTEGGETSINWGDNSSVTGMEFQAAHFTGDNFSITALPETPENIEGDNSVCTGTASSTYTISTIEGATGYVWDIDPDSAADIEDDGTNATLFWSTDFTGTANLSVAGINSCDTGYSANKTIQIDDNVTISIEIDAQPDTACQDDTVTIIADGENGGNDPQYLWYVNDQLQDTENSSTFVSDDFEDGDEVFCKLLSSQSCVENNLAPSNTITLEITPSPERPTTIWGDSEMCTTNPYSDYTTPGSANATSYNWMIYPERAIDSMYCMDETCKSLRIDWKTDTNESIQYFLYVQGVNECGVSTPSPNYTIYRDFCTSTGSGEAIEKWSVYPNPAKDKLYINKGDSKSLEWQLITTTGLMLKENLLMQQQTAIRLNNLPSGIYLLRVKSDRGTTVKKLIIE